MIIKCVGHTPEHLPVYKGVYRFFETHGLPLSVLFECFKQRKMMVGWIDFYQEAIQAGMKHQRVLSKLEEAISDVWGKSFSDQVLLVLEECYGQ